MVGLEVDESSCDPDLALDPGRLRKGGAREQVTTVRTLVYRGMRASAKRSLFMRIRGVDNDTA